MTLLSKLPARLSVVNSPLRVPTTPDLSAITRSTVVLVHTRHFWSFILYLFLLQNELLKYSYGFYFLVPFVTNYMEMET